MYNLYLVTQLQLFVTTEHYVSGPWFAGPDSPEVPIGKFCKVIFFLGLAWKFVFVMNVFLMSFKKKKILGSKPASNAVFSAPGTAAVSEQAITVCIYAAQHGTTSD